jgi:hypothetical protein
LIILSKMYNKEGIMSISFVWGELLWWRDRFCYK